jgi:2,5-diketo-D-gluconate reductase A
MTTVFCIAAACTTSFSGDVPTVTLNNGLAMPVIALGTAGYDNATAAAAVKTAFAAGVTHVHAAFDYFNLPGVGRGLAAAPAGRAGYFLTGMTSPCIHPAAPPKRNVSDPAACEALTTAEVDTTLALLGVQHVDLLLLHGPSAPFGSTDGCSPEVCAVNAAQWRAYEAALAAGKTKAIGVSNFCQSCFECLAGAGVTVPAVNQIQLHVGTGADPEGLVSYHKARGIVTQAYAPLAAGEVVSDPLTAAVAATLPPSAVGKPRSAAQVGLRWVLQSAAAGAGRMALVVKADDRAYLAEDLDVFGWALPDAAVQQLDAATTPKGQQAGRPSWGCAK